MTEKKRNWLNSAVELRERLQSDRVWGRGGGGETNSRPEARNCRFTVRDRIIGPTRLSRMCIPKDRKE